MSGKRKRRRRFAADRLVAALLGSADGNAEVALRRAKAQRDRHRFRAHFEAQRRNYGAAARHRHIADRLDRAIRLLTDAGGWLHSGGPLPLARCRRPATATRGRQTAHWSPTLRSLNSALTQGLRLQKAHAVSPADMPFGAHDACGNDGSE